MPDWTAESEAAFDAYVDALIGVIGHADRAEPLKDCCLGLLMPLEAGAKAADLARKHGISEATLYNWKAKYGGMDVSDSKRLRALEEENAKLKKLLADQMLEASALRELLSKKW